MLIINRVILKKFYNCGLSLLAFVLSYEEFSQTQSKLNQEEKYKMRQQTIKSNKEVTNSTQLNVVKEILRKDTTRVNISIYRSKSNNSVSNGRLKPDVIKKFIILN